MEKAPDDPAVPTKSKFGMETVLGVAGALVIVGFFLPWMDLAGQGGVSGMSLALEGGAWAGLWAIPALALLTAGLGALRLDPCRYTGLGTAVAMLVPLAYVLALHMAWYFWLPLLAGATCVVLGKLSRGLVVATPLGTVLVIGCAATVLFGVDMYHDLLDGHAQAKEEKSTEEGEEKNAEEGEEKTAEEGEKKSAEEGEEKSAEEGEKKKNAEEGEDDKSADEEESDAGLAATILAGPLALLWLLLSVGSAWLLFAGARKKGQARPLVFVGWSILALSAYAAALMTFGSTLRTGGIGLWMVVVGGALLLILSAPLRNRKKRARAKGEDTGAQKDEKKRARKAEKEAAKAEKEAAKAEAEAKAEKDAEKKRAAKAEDKDKAGAAEKPDQKAEKKPEKKAEKKAQKKAEKKPDQKPDKKPDQKPDKKLDPEAEMAKKRARLEELRKRKLEAEKLQREEEETARRGAELADAPEPVFAADPNAPPPPENEDREALMQRMGVKKPPPPSASELDDMLAALKKRTDDDS